MPLQLPPGYFIRELPGHGYRPEGPGGVPLAEPQPTYYGALGICVEHWENELSLGARPNLRPPLAPTDGSEVLLPGVGVVGREAFTGVPGPYPYRTFSPQGDAGPVVIRGDATAGEPG
jgi:hypothetical protein